MARIRSLKPELPSDKKLASVPIDVRYTFVLILSRADDYGLLLAEPRQLLGELYPHDDLTPKCVLNWIQILVQNGFLRWRETTDGARIIEVCNWKKHQKIRDPGKPLLRNRLRPVEKQSAEIPRSLSGETPPTQRRNSADSPPADRERDRERERERERDQTDLAHAKNHRGISGKSPELHAGVFSEAWSLYPKRPNNSRSAALKAWEARIRAGCDPQAMLAGVRAYAAFVAREGTAPKYIKQAATFFGPGKHFEADYGSDDELVRISDESGTPTKALLDALGVRAPA